MRKALLTLCLAAAFAIGFDYGAGAADPMPAGGDAAVTEGWHHGGGHRRGGRGGRGWNRNGCWTGQDDAWQCSGGNYHYGPDNGGYRCH